jgi:hypothetical protein
MVMDEPSSVTKEYYVYFPWRPFARRRSRTGFPVSFKRPDGSELEANPSHQLPSE